MPGPLRLRQGRGCGSFSIAPIRAATILGLGTVVLTSGFALFALFARLFLGQVPQGFTSLILVVTFMTGMNLLFLGVVGEYVGRIYEEVKRRPLYVVRGVQGQGKRKK